MNDETNKIFDYESLLCIICCDKPKSVALIHKEKKTSHIVCCNDCSQKLKECPVCREPIDLIINHVHIKSTRKIPYNPIPENG